MAVKKEWFTPQVRAIMEASKLSFAVFGPMEEGFAAVLVSAGACEIFGMDRQELVQYLDNRSFARIHPEDVGKLASSVWRLSGQEEVTVICRMCRHGEWHPVLFHAVPQERPGGQVLCYVTYTDLQETGVEVQAAEQEYRRSHRDQLYRDEVTGLPNANYYQSFAGGRLKEFLDRGEEPRVLLFDIRGMHAYNDRFGYAAGDALLRQTGELLREVFDDELCVRYTEDHFVVLSTRRDCRQRVARVRERFLSLAGDAAVDLDAGIYTCRDREEGSIEVADRARRAVDYLQGHPELHVYEYDGEVERIFRWRSYVLSHYKEAIRQGWIQVYYQPLIDSISSRVAHAEALARWIDPERGLLSPADFVGILEENHRILELDLYVLERVCRDIQTWRREGRTIPRFSVNLSRQDLGAKDLHERIGQILQRYGVLPQEIAIEITESALAEHEELIESHIRRFHEEGHEVWLDDFGSGYSSFGALQDFDFDLLKIDMRFLQKANARTPDILREIIDLSKRLGMRSVTEGVETAQQVDFLRKIGCCYLQGYHYARPIPGEQFCEELERRGLQVESVEDRGFFEQLMRVNVLNPDNPLPESQFFRRMGEDRSLTLLTEEEGRVQFIYTDETGERWMRGIGEETLEDISERFNTAPMPVHRTMRECMAQLHEPGDTVTTPVDDPQLQGRMEVELIACSGRHRGYLVCCIC